MMTDDEKTALKAAEQFMDLTSECDWTALHDVIAEDLVAGKYGEEFRLAYRDLVTRKAQERLRSSPRPPGADYFEAARKAEDEHAKRIMDAIGRPSTQDVIELVSTWAARQHNGGDR